MFIEFNSPFAFAPEERHGAPTERESLRISGYKHSAPLEQKIN
jgi:hypothetical protein